MLARDYARGMREELYKTNKPVMKVSADEWLMIADMIEKLAVMAVENFRDLVVQELQENAERYHELARKNKEIPIIRGGLEAEARAYEDLVKTVISMANITLRTREEKEGEKDEERNEDEQEMER